MRDYIEQHLETLGYEYSVSAKHNAYEINLYFDDNRKQRVYVSRKNEHVNGVDFREIWSPACALLGQLSSAVALRLLENNYYRAIGAWSYNAKEHVVYFTCRVPDTLTQDTLDAILVAVASDADRLEQKLTGNDIM